MASERKQRSKSKSLEDELASSLVDAPNDDSSLTDASNHSGSDAAPDDEMTILRGLLMDGYESHIHDLAAQMVDVTQEMETVNQKIDSMDGRIGNTDALLETINPVIASSIRDKIRDSRGEMIDALSPIMADTIRQNINESKEEMVEALYPLVGQLVQRLSLIHISEPTRP